MSTPFPSALPTNPAGNLQARFLVLLPRVELHGRVYFRHLKCAESRREAVAEMVALCWRWFVRLHERGKDPETFVSALASFAARAVKSGRRVCGGVILGMQRRNTARRASPPAWTCSVRN